LKPYEEYFDKRIEQLMSYSPYFSTDYSYDNQMSTDSSFQATYNLFNPPNYQAQTSLQSLNWHNGFVQNSQQNTDVCSLVTPQQSGGEDSSFHWGENSDDPVGETGNNPFVDDYCSSHSASFC
jgi:hypothetical protein